MKEILLSRVQCTYATSINICAYRGLCQGMLLLASFRIHHYRVSFNKHDPTAVFCNFPDTITNN